MISVLSSSLAATFPWLLIGIPCALSLLIYIYRVRGSSKQTVVSSLIFLQDLPRRPAGRRTFVPPPQFWLELAVFTLLILAAAGLFVRQTGKHVAIVIDSSLSMAALSGSAGTGLEQAKRSASLDVQRESSSTTFSVYSSAVTLEPLSPARSGSTQALVAISGAAQSYRGDALDESVATLLSDSSLDAIWIYTDRPLSGGTASSRVTATSLPFDPSTQTNAWIHSIQERPNDGASSLEVGVGYAGGQPREARLDGECYDERGVTSQLGPVSIGLSTSTRSRGALSLNGATWKYCKARVRLKDPSLYDSLPLDNEGWISRETSKSSWLLSSPLSPDRLGLSQITSITFTDLNQEARPSSGSQLPIVMHRQALSALPKEPVFLILPPTGPLPWGGEILERSTNSREVTRWDSAHPTLAYANPSTLELSDVRPIRCPDSSTAILFSSVGPIACAGEFNGLRYLIVGFEIFPFEGARAPTLSIVMLNSFKWLSQSSLHAAGSELPNTIKVPDGAVSAAYLKPQEVPLAISESRLVAPNSPGIVAFTYPDRSQKVVALNSFLDSESDLAARAPLSLPPPTPLTTTKPSPSSARDLTLILASLALSVLAIDIARRLIRGSKWSDA